MGAPIRELDQFCVFAVQEGAAPALWSIDCVSQFLGSQPPNGKLWPSVLYAHGSLVPQTAHNEGKPVEMVLVGPILDWTVILPPLSVHVAPAPATVAVRTAAAWYRLVQPAHAYAAVFARPLLFAHSCSLACVVLAKKPPPSLPDFLLALCKELTVQHGYMEHLVAHVHVRLSFALDFWPLCACPLLLL